MAATRVQSVSNQTQTTSIPVTATQGWVAPTVGNLIVAWYGGDNTCTAPAGYTAGPSVVDGNAIYFWWKIAVSGDSAGVTFTQSGASPGTAGLVEYSGVVSASPVETAGGSATTASSGTQGTTIGTLSQAGTGTSGDLFVALTGLHSWNSATAPTSPAWTNSFTNFATVTQAAASPGQSEATFLADFQNTSAATPSTTCSWTNLAGDRNGLLIAFKLAPPATARVQSAGNVTTTGTSITLGSGNGWAAPTAGNLLILVVNAAFTATNPAGWTVGPSVVDDNACYLWWKIAAGTETSISVTQGGSSSATIFCVEYAASFLAPTPFDLQNFSNTTGTTGTVTAAAAITTTGAGGDTVFAAACLCRDTTGSTLPTGLTWSNSYTAIFNHASAGNLGASDVSTWYAELQQGAPGATSTVATWTNGWNARQGLIIGFKRAAAGAAPIPNLVMPHWI